MKRRSNLKISEKELEDYMQVIIDSFSLDFLTNDSNHPIQILWKRNDELATNELFSLAYSIKELSKIDSKWTKEQIKIAKSKERNNSRGAIFEILSLNMLNSPEHPVVPAKINQAGYDGLVTKSGNQEMRVSIKNYGISNPQQRFEKKAKEVEQIILKLLKKYNYPPSQILLDFPDKYPEEHEWKMLLDRIDNIFQNQRNAQEPFAALVEPVNPLVELSKENSKVVFTIAASPFKNKIEQFHPNLNSYTLMISGVYHQNEHLNLYSKIEEACSNLSTHSAIENDKIINSLFIHLPDTISLSKCTNWLNDYFDLFPDKPISIVFLYQPTIALDLAANNTVINNCFNVYIRANRQIKGNYNFCIPVGRVSQESSNLIFIAEYPDGHKETFPLEDRYIYQHGEHYMRMMPDGKGGFQGNIQKLGSGVFVNAVIEFPGQPGSAIISGRFAPNDELLIL